jgi:predicted DsbA family dithiol-disulfide isomerase
MTDATPLPIDVVSDVVCPWCYIGKRFLERAIALKPEIPVEVRFRPYFLNPWVPREGISREQYLVTKFGSVERYNANSQRIVDAAAYAGLDYARDKIKRQPNTLDCHRLIRWADANAAAMKQRLMEIYFSEGGDLTSRDVLVQAAVDVGLDGDVVRRKVAHSRPTLLRRRSSAPRKRWPSVLLRSKCSFICAPSLHKRQDFICLG